ncbi:MAG: hypothetical protein U0Q12_27505 [Vicinamibacterales bacterium]
MGQILRIAPTARSKELVDAGIAELVRMNAEVARRRTSPPEGIVGSTDPAIGEYYGDVVQMVAGCEDVAAIPALVGALSTGNMVIKALARFGEQALPQVLAVATADNRDNVVRLSSAIRALQFMVVQPISAVSRARIMASVRPRLEGRQQEGVWMAALDFAAASKDPGLLESLRSVAATGVSLAQVEDGEQETANRIQAHAERALARTKKP